MALGLLALVSRLFYLHFIDANHGRDFLKKQGDMRVLRVQPLTASRGEIVDRNGELLAYSTPVKSIWVNPSKLSRDDSALLPLAELLDMSLAEIDKRLKANDHYVFLRRQLSPEKADAIMALEMAGVHTETEYKRFYPAAEMAAHIVGFTDVDDNGQEGVELAFDAVLRGEPGSRRIMKNARGEIIRDLRLIKPAATGEPVTLSLDMNLQYAAYRELKAAVAEHGARSASMVILDVTTGEVLALVNQPSYNVNDRSQLAPGLTRNRALIDVFEPGSTAKPFTMAAALESKKFSPHTSVETAPGYIRVGKKTIIDPKNYGTLKVTDVLVKSSQVGTTKIALSLPASDLRAMFSRVGFGEFCATGFPGEQVGFLPNQRRWLPIQRATLAFGHGMSVNTLQLARAYLAIAADGIKHPVTLLKNDAQNAQVGGVDDLPSSRVFDADIAQQLRAMMTKVVLKGTGKKAAIAGYSVAGKTGTSHKVGAGGYQENRYRATFAGMVPASNPRFVAVVTVDDPQGMVYYGGEVAAPVFSRVMGSALRLWNIPPDLPEQLDANYLMVNAENKAARGQFNAG
jgi:cell division protein FtsI (penicillin-binding protein 3)